MSPRRRKVMQPLQVSTILPAKTGRVPRGVWHAGRFTRRSRAVHEPHPGNFTCRSPGQKPQGKSTSYPQRTFQNWKTRQALTNLFPGPIRLKCFDSDLLTPHRLPPIVPSMFRGMGGKDPNRQPRLSSIRDTPPGWLRLAICLNCDHRGPLPAARLIRNTESLP